jgi:hypothetical protein
MFERFGWRRLGGSVFRYEGVRQDGEMYEDWLNHIVPALMFMRSYIVERDLDLSFFTVSASGSSFIDNSDPGNSYGNQPLDGDNLNDIQPTNEQSSIRTIRQFIDEACQATR